MFYISSLWANYWLVFLCGFASEVSMTTRLCVAGCSLCWRGIYLLGFHFDTTSLFNSFFFWIFHYRDTLSSHCKRFLAASLVLEAVNIDWGNGSSFCFSRADC